jgi:hypothetical protein
MSFNVLSAKTYAYQLLNLTGAIGLAIVAFSHKDKQPAILNIVWALVAVVVLIQLITK